MMQFLEFTFQDFTHFVGILILIGLIGSTFEGIASSFRRKP